MTIGCFAGLKTNHRIEKVLVGDLTKVGSPPIYVELRAARPYVEPYVDRASVDQMTERHRRSLR